MSWKTAGKLVAGPPIASGSGSTSSIRYRPNLGGLNAFQREQEFASHYSSSKKGKKPETQGRTDYDVLKENHRYVSDGSVCMDHPDGIGSFEMTKKQEK
jgi:protein FRA10AC1